MDDRQTIPPWPGPGAPGRRARFTAAVRAASARGDWPTVAAALSKTPSYEMPASLVLDFLAAAMALGTAEVMTKAVCAGIEAELPPPIRARFAWRLAFADYSAEAWMVLNADPAVMTEHSTYAIISQALARISYNSSAPVTLRAAAGALRRRHANRDPIRREPAPYGFAVGPGGARPGAGPAEIVPAPGTPHDVLNAYRSAVSRFEAELAGRDDPNVTQLRDVFVNRVGQIWQPNEKMIADRGRPLSGPSREAMAGAPTVPCGLLAIEAHNSIYHWMVDWLPSLAWRFEPGGPDLPILIRDDPASFVVESLAMAAGPALPVLHVGDAVRVEKLLIGSFGLNSVAPLGGHRRLLDAVGKAADATPPPLGARARKLYVSRRDSPRRAMGNEAALEQELARLGFQCVMFTPLSLSAKLRLVRDADIIVGPHGAGLGMLLYARPGTAVYEIMPGSISRAQLTTCMTRCSRLAGLRHRMWLEATNPTTGAWSVNLAAMLPDLTAFTDAAAPVT